MKEKLRLRDKLRQNAKNSGRLEDWAAYIKCRNCCVKELRKCKIEFHEKLYQKMENEKTTENLTSELLDRRDGCTPQQFLRAGRLVRRPEDMANMQMDFYKSQVDKTESRFKVRIGDH